MTTTPNIPIGGAVTLLYPLLIAGQRTASVTAVYRAKLPRAYKVLDVQATARASGGTGPTLTVDVKAGGTSLLSAPVAVTAGAVAHATLASGARVADEAELTVDLAIGGTLPTWDDIALQLTLTPV